MDAFDHWVDAGTPAEVAFVAVVVGLVVIVNRVLIWRIRDRRRSQSSADRTCEGKPN